ncbi:MAG: glycerophosphodiester phosphodiesterase family protein, partial [Sphingobacteriaceae bacterium]
AYLKANNKPQVFYNIETKSSPAGDNKLQPEPEVFVKLLMEVIEAKKITPWVIIQSFDFRTLQVLNKKYPHVRTSYLVQKGTLDENLNELGFKPDIYSPNYKMVTAELVKQCHDKDIKVIPWTANTKEDIEHLKSLGVDGIISDYPNLF